jgi:hypothetical protein
LAAPVYEEQRSVDPDRELPAAELAEQPVRGRAVWNVRMKDKIRLGRF